jgi:type IV secretion system protein VirD4
MNALRLPKPSCPSGPQCSFCARSSIDLRSLSMSPQGGHWLWLRIGVVCLLICLPTAFYLGYARKNGGPPLALRLLGSFTGALAIYAFLRALGEVPARTAHTLHGSARWETDADLSRHWLLLPEKTLPPPEAFLLGLHHYHHPLRHVTRPIALPPEIARLHGIILGGTGSGKTRGFFLPNAACSQAVSHLMTDPKSELWEYTSGLHREAWRFAPTEPDRSRCFNWIPLCREARYAELCARTLIEAGEDGPRRAEAIWIEAETAFLSALFAHAATLPEPTPLTAYRLFTRQSQEALLKVLKASSSEVAQEQAYVFEQTQDRMRGSIVPAVAAKLQFLRDDLVARFTSAELTPPDFGALRKRPIAVYWVLSEQDMPRLRPLTSLFFLLAFEQIGGVTGDNGLEGEPCPEELVPVRALLDETGNIGVLPHFDSTLTLARSRGIAFYLGLQSLSQLTDRYGKSTAETILANCSTKIALAGLDIDSAEYISRCLGQTTLVTSRRSLSTEGIFGPVQAIGYSRAETERALLTPDEVRRLGRNQALVVSANRPPLLLEKFWYSASACPALAPSLGQARREDGHWSASPTTTGNDAAQMSLPMSSPQETAGKMPPMPVSRNRVGAAATRRLRLEQTRPRRR